MTLYVEARTGAALESIRDEMDLPSVNDAVRHLIEGYRAATPPARTVTGAPRRDRAPRE